MTHELPSASSGCCTNCGSGDLMLARDYTAYSPCEYFLETDTWGPLYEDMQAADAPGSVRFFCTECGTQHAVPKELE